MNKGEVFIPSLEILKDDSHMAMGINLGDGIVTIGEFKLTGNEDLSKKVEVAVNTFNDFVFMFLHEETLDEHMAEMLGNRGRKVLEKLLAESKTGGN